MKAEFHVSRDFHNDLRLFTAFSIRVEELFVKMSKEDPETDGRETALELDRALAERNRFALEVAQYVERMERQGGIK